MPLFLIFVVAPLIELYVIVKTGQRIGYLNTIGLLLLVAFVGTALVKREGVKVWGRFVEQVQAGQAPSKEIADGVCLLLAGALLIAPGFVSDVLALLLLLPPTRAVFRRWLLRRKSFGAFGQARVIRATYGGAPPGVRSTDITDTTSTETTSTETRGELDP